MSMWWSLHLRREAASVPLARRLLVGTMETAGVDPEISYDLSVALSEACANAVEHGGDSSTGYLVTAFIDGDTCRIEVTDSGPGFPEQPRPRDRRRTQRPAAPGGS
ncbi:ATP-binding protein, partial [Streptomyces albireticuli]